MNMKACGCEWDSGSFIVEYCPEHADQDVEAECDRYQAALELIASGTVGPAIMRMTACEVLGLEPPVWTALEGPADAQS